MYKVPEQFRLTKQKAKAFSYIGKEILDMVSDDTHKDDGYFFIPPFGGKGEGMFLCRHTIKEGWHMLAINIPNQGRDATWEEIDYIRRIFFGDSVVFMFFPGEHTYITKRWVHVWQPETEPIGKMFMPPLFHTHFAFRRAPFFLRLWRAFKRAWKWEVAVPVKKAFRAAAIKLLFKPKPTQDEQSESTAAPSEKVRENPVPHNAGEGDHGRSL